MFTRTSRVALIWLGLLAGCAGGGGVVGPASDTLSVQLAGRDVTLHAPVGFCFDAASRDRNAVGVSVLLADCAVLGLGAPKDTPLGVVLTTTLSRDAAPPEDWNGLEAMLRSPAGAAILGGGAAAEVLDSAQAEGVLFLKVRRDARAVQPTAAEDQWRGFFVLADRLVTVTVTGFRGAAPADSAARALIAEMARASRAATGQAAPATVAT